MKILDLKTTAGAYAASHNIAVEVVALGQIVHRTKGTAIHRISRKYKLGSFLKKVFHGEPATVHLHLYHRLCTALEDLNAEQVKRISDNDKLLARLRGHDAAHKITRSVDQVRH